MNLDHIDIEELFDAVARDMNEGFCIHVLCGEKSYGVEPDCREERCPTCGEFSVYGAEEVLNMYAGSELDF